MKLEELVEYQRFWSFGVEIKEKDSTTLTFYDQNYLISALEIGKKAFFLNNVIYMKICINACEMKFVHNVTQGKEYSEVKNNWNGFVLLITQKIGQQM